MKLRSIKMVVLAGMILAVLLVSTVGAAQSTDDSDQKSPGKQNGKYIYDDVLKKGSTFPRSSSQLGSNASDGGSPGYIVGRTYRDDQAHFNPNRMVGSGDGPMVHFVFGAQACAGEDNPEVCARWLHYNMFNPTIAPNGVWVSGASGIPMHNMPFIEGGIYPQMDVSYDDHIIAAGEVIDASQAEDATRRTKVFWDIDPSWGTFLDDTLDEETIAPALNPKYPQIALQEYDGQFYTHVVALGDAGSAPGTRQIVYHCSVNSSFSPNGSWTSEIISDSAWSDSYSLAASHYGTYVAIAWTQFRDVSQTDDLGAHLWVTESFNNGSTWDIEYDLINFNLYEDSWQPWLECNALIDRDEYLHVVWNASEYSAEMQSANSINPARVYHWTNRVSGPDAGGTTSLIHHHETDTDIMCGRFLYHDLALGRPVISQCNERMYVIWKQAGDPQTGTFNDCADTTLIGYNGGYNADIFLSTSLSLDGTLWDRSRNLTNSHAPECDGSDEMPCDHDVSASMSRKGYEAAAMGTTYWSAVPEAFEVRDILDPMWPEEDWYIDVQYVNDIFPGSARFYGDEGIWTNNPIKWFRLPCVPPIIDPELFIAQKQITHPNFWIKSGELKTVDIEIMNMGNAPLSVSDVTPHDVQGSGWYIINTTYLTIEPASSDYISISLNPALIDPGPGNAYGIEAWFLVDCDDPQNTVDSFLIRTVITDTVVPYTYDIVRTGMGVPMGPTNIGTAGNYPHTDGYMQFYEEGGIDEDCDFQNVYLYDMTPVVMTDPSTGWWAPNYNPVNPDSNAFVPVPGGGQAEFCSLDALEQFLTGDFVTSDSAIGMNKTWVAPTDNVSFVIERWEIFSRDGGWHSDVQLGEYLDIDVPSDTGVNNFGGVVEADDYIWMSGQETDNDVSCTQSDGRFYAAGLLGYYYTSEYAYDPWVNHTGLDGAYVTQYYDLMDNSDNLIADSVWAFLGRSEFNANNTEWGDQRAFLAYGGFDIKPDDTLVIWTVHGSLINATETDVANQIAAAKTWYMDNRDDVVDCVWYTCGDLNGDDRIVLSDITLLLDHLYISKDPLEIPEAAELDLCDTVDFADLILLHDHIYVTKHELCTEVWDCDPSMPHDVVRLTISHRPNVSEGDFSLQVDLYVRNTVDLAGAAMGFTWDSPKLTFDFFDMVNPFWNFFFEVNDSARWAQFDALWLSSQGPAPSLGIDEYRHWGSFHFTVNNWLPTDTVTFDLAPDSSSVTKFVTLPYHEPGILSYKPRWDGPVVVRDAGEYGDVDGDGEVGPEDVVQLTDYLFLGNAMDLPSDLGNANGCDGTDVADLRYMINMAYEGAPPVATSSCDYGESSDLVGLYFTNWPVEGAAKFRADQPLELELYVRNAETVTEATMAFSWDNQNLIMDSAIAGPVAITGFPQSIVLYENNLLSLTNAGQLFNFKGSAGQEGPGVPGDSIVMRLWATYHFTLTNWTTGDEVMIDTMVFSDGSAFKLVNESGEGHNPQWHWQPPYACCGTRAGGYTGNVDWEDDMVGTVCDLSGRRNLADITRLIDRVYVSKEILCCPKNGNTDGDELDKINLSDITRLIDHVYVSKGETSVCQ